jgi:hypothetical protein
MREIFGKRLVGGEIENPRKRTDILVLGDATVSGVATERFEELTLPTMSQVLLLELKRGGAEITREHVNQATNYVQDFLGSRLIEGEPFFRVFVIGHTVSQKVQPRLDIPPRAKIEVATYAHVPLRRGHRQRFAQSDSRRTRTAEAHESVPMSYIDKAFEADNPLKRCTVPMQRAISLQASRGLRQSAE